MGHARRALAHAIWRELSSSNQWQLFPDEGALIEAVVAATATLASGDGDDRRIRDELQRRYSLRLYEAVTGRDERACFELRLMFYRLALRSGLPPFDAEDLAQGAMTQVLAKLGQVRRPDAFLAWTLTVFRTTERAQGPQQRHSSLDETGERAASQLSDGDLLAAEVEQRLVAEELVGLLRELLPNQLEWLTLIRCVLLGDNPRDVARELGLPLHRTRVAKARALQRLRGDVRFMAFLDSLSDRP